MDRARHGDLAAFEYLLSPLIEPACQLARAILSDWYEAEDAVQEAALRAWGAVVRLRDRGQLGGRAERAGGAGDADRRP